MRIKTSEHNDDSLVVVIRLMEERDAMHSALRNLVDSMEAPRSKKAIAAYSRAGVVLAEYWLASNGVTSVDMTRATKED